MQRLSAALWRPEKDYPVLSTFFEWAKSLNHDESTVLPKEVLKTKLQPLTSCLVDIVYETIPPAALKAALGIYSIALEKEKLLKNEGGSMKNMTKDCLAKCLGGWVGGSSDSSQILS